MFDRSAPPASPRDRSVRLAIRNLRTAAVAGALAAVAMAAVSLAQLPALQVYLWLGYMVCAAATSLGLVAWWRIGGTRRGRARWVGRLMLAAAVQGLGWGAAFPLLLPFTDGLLRAGWVMVLCVVCAGAFAALWPCLPALRAFLAGISLALMAAAVSAAQATVQWSLWVAVLALGVGFWGAGRLNRHLWRYRELERDRVRLTGSTSLTGETREVRGSVVVQVGDQTSIEAGYDNANRESGSSFGNLGVDFRWHLEFD